KLPATYRLELLKQITDFKPKRESERRLQALILTIIETGLRVSEAISLHIEKIDFDNLLIYLEGKGRKERAVAFSYELRKVLWRWRGTRQNGLLFATREGTKLGRRNVLRDFKRLCRRLGFEAVPRSLHALRHTFAVNYLRNGGSVFHLQKALGHSSLEQSRQYANLLAEDLQQMQQRVSLLNRMR